MDFLNGKKTYIGGGLMAAGVFLTQLGYADLGSALNEFGMAIAAVGIGHKLAKQ